MMSTVSSTVVLLPVETGWTCPGLFVFLHATLHSLGWPWCRFLSARRSWPGSPSLIHQPLLPLLKHCAFCDVSCATIPHVCCVCICLYFCVCVCVWWKDDKMPDNRFKDFIIERDFLFLKECASHWINYPTKYRITFHFVRVLEPISEWEITSDEHEMLTKA